MPGTASSAARDVVAVGAGVEHDRPVGDAPRPADERAAAAARHRQRRRVERGEPAGDGNTCVSGRRRSSAASPTAATMRPVTVRAPATETCWPTTPARPSRTGRRCRARAARGRRRRAAPARGSSASAASTATGSASRSSSRRIRCTAGPRSRQSASRSAASAPDVRLVGGVERRATPWPCGQASARWYARRRPSASTPGTARAEERDHVVAGERLARRRGAADDRRRGSAGRVADRRTAPQLASASSANTSRTVSLNWRTLPKPAANATSVKGEVGRLDQRAGGAGPAGRGRGRAGRRRARR